MRTFTAIKNKIMYRCFFVVLAVLTANLVFAKPLLPHFINLSDETPENLLCFFIPPEGWEIADPKTLAPQVKIAFLKASKKGLCPSINLAIEETPATLSEYLKAVKTIHEQNRNNQWRTLGKVHTPAGLAQLTEIDSTSEFGPIRILQLILIQEGHAYILTAAALKTEMPDYYKDFQRAFRSLTLTSDLCSSIPQLERRESLKEKQRLLLQEAEQALSLVQAQAEGEALFADSSFQTKHWLPFQTTILENFADMGPFWQILFLKTTQEKLLSIQLSTIEIDRQNSPSEIQ